MVRFIEYFKISVVMAKYYKNLKKQCKESKYFISDCNLHVAKNKQMFKYCEYFMIIGYFDNIYFDLFYNPIFYKEEQGKRICAKNM